MNVLAQAAVQGGRCPHYALEVTREVRLVGKKDSVCYFRWSPGLVRQAKETLDVQFGLVGVRRRAHSAFKEPTHAAIRET